jgi:hypothetical protein
MKKGQRVKSGGIVGTILKIGEKRMVERANPNKPYEGDGKPFEVKDVYVKYKLPNGKQVKGWWDLSKCKAI